MHMPLPCRCGLILVLPILLVSTPVSADGFDPGRCSIVVDGRSIALHGSYQIVDSFPDFTVQEVSSFPDLRVQEVTNFPDACGQWKEVQSFPDFRIKIVSSFPDLKIQRVQNFPGVP